MLKDAAGAQIDLDLEFVESSGKVAPLSRYFNGERPVALTLNYYECPTLCVLQLQGLLDTLHKEPADRGWTS